MKLSVSIFFCLSVLSSSFAFAQQCVRHNLCMANCKPGWHCLQLTPCGSCIDGNVKEDKKNKSENPQAKFEDLLRVPVVSSK